MSADRYTCRQEILDGARDAVLKQRNNTYGPPTQDFDRSARILNSLGFMVVDSAGNASPISSHHIAILLMAVKLSRITWNPTHKDSWLDLAGYAACGYECAVSGLSESKVVDG